VLQASCDAVPSLEQTVESWQRFAATMLLKFTNPRLNRCGPSIQVDATFDLGLRFRAFAFPFLNEFD
jgi:hypothetical protein